MVAILTRLGHNVSTQRHISINIDSYSLVAHKVVISHVICLINMTAEIFTDYSDEMYKESNPNV